MTRPSEARGAECQQMVLRETLALAVPLHIRELQRFSPERLCTIASVAADTVGRHGDDLQLGGKHCAETFNALARGLAAAALTADGGIDFAGRHWCARPGCRASSRMEHADDSAYADPDITAAEPVQPLIHDVSITGRLL